MRLINADKLKDEIWLSPICLRDEQKQIAMTMVDEAKTVEAVPLELPENFERFIDEPEHVLTLLPHKNMTDGFFIAKFRKVGQHD